MTAYVAAEAGRANRAPVKGGAFCFTTRASFVGSQAQLRLSYVRNPFTQGTMARRAGSADLQLPGGRVPPWLASRMATLGAIITQAIVHHYGRVP
jgi:hypothetical protein